MQPALKTRLLGAAVLIALLVIVVPLFFSGKPGGGGSQSISLDIPQSPDQTLQTRTMSVAPAPSAAASAPAGGSNKLATVDIPSRVPQDVHPEASTSDANSSAGQVPATTSAPPAPEPETTTSPAPQTKTSTKAAADKHAPDATSHPGKAAVSRYRITLGAYADKANAKRLVAKVGKLGYPVQLQATRIGGKPAARVDVGPFDSRAAAESARLKLHGALPRAPAKLVSAPADQTHNAPVATRKSKTRAGGWAVQVVAYSEHAEANKLRDKLRAAGFDSYVDDVRSGGHTLWRVRVGPMTQRSEALSVQKSLHGKFPRLQGVVVDVP